MAVGPEELTFYENIINKSADAKKTVFLSKQDIRICAKKRVPIYRGSIFKNLFSYFDRLNRAEIIE